MTEIGKVLEFMKENDWHIEFDTTENGGTGYAIQCEKGDETFNVYSGDGSNAELIEDLYHLEIIDKKMKNSWLEEISEYAEGD